MIRTDSIGRRALKCAAGAFVATSLAVAVGPFAFAQSAKPKPAATSDSKGKPATNVAAKADPKKPASGKQAPAAAGAAAAAPAGKPALVGTFGEWGAYAATAGRAKTCYALGQPKERQPASLKRDPAYIFVSFRPAEGVRNEVSLVMGFDVKPDSNPTAEIGSANFELIAKGANLWVKNAAAEGQFVDAMRKGAKLVVKAASRRGGVTTDTYLLTGVAQALDRVQKDCQ